MRRTRQRPRPTLANNDSWTNHTNANKGATMPQESDQIGMHVRVLRYHEIRLGNIEKQLANLSRQLSNIGTNSNRKGTSIAKKTVIKPDSSETVNQLQGVLKSLAEEVASSNKMIKQFITGDKVGFTEAVLKNREPVQLKKEKQIDECDTLEWKLAKSRLVRCGIRASDERIRDMVLAMKEEVELVADILENHTEKLEKSVEKAVIEKVETVIETENQSDEKKSLENMVLSDDATEDTSGEDETVNISTSNDIGYVPVHVVVKKKRGRPKKKKVNAK